MHSRPAVLRFRRRTAPAVQQHAHGGTAAIIQGDFSCGLQRRVRRVRRIRSQWRGDAAER